MEYRTPTTAPTAPTDAPPLPTGAGSTLQSLLEQLMAEHPEHADVLGKAKSRIRHRERATPDHRYKVICNELRDGAQLVSELVEETGFNKQQIMADLCHLVDARIVEERTVHDARKNSGRGGKTLNYFLRNAAAFSRVIGDTEADLESDLES